MINKSNIAIKNMINLKLIMMMINSFHQLSHSKINYLEKIHLLKKDFKMLN
jgi:hypothetical protein